MSAARDSLLGLRESVLGTLEQGEAAWIGGLREEALVAFEEQGFPTRRLENWKGTNLAPLDALHFEHIANAEPAPVVVTGDGAPTFEFVDGRLQTATSQAANQPRGVRLLSLAEARRQSPELLEGRLGQLTDLKTQPLVALQTAFLDDGAVLSIDADVVLDAPIRLRFGVAARADGAATAAFPRLLVLVGERSRAAIYIEHATVIDASSAAPEPQAPGLTAFVAEVHLAAHAKLEAVQVQAEDAQRIHFTSTHARLESGAEFDSHVLSLSDGLVRSELEIALTEANAATRMRGFFLGRGEGHVDHFTTVDHAAESCTSDQEYRGVLGDDSDGVFRGRVIIRPGAQKTDARQSNPNLLVSQRARIDTKPQLEIYADDVKASHGSTIGQLDPDALFFLRARGIGEGDARLLLTRAFAQTIVDGIEDEALRTIVGPRVDEGLAALGGVGADEGEPIGESST